METNPYAMEPPLRLDPPRLIGSRDPMTGEEYFPQRTLSVDGKLRKLETVDMPTEGVLWSFTRMGKSHYGQVDLPNRVRILTVLAPAEYEVGWRCRLEVVPPDTEGGTPGWRFTRA